MTEQAHLGGAALAPEEVSEWVGQEGGEWMAPEQVLAPEENVSALNAAMSFATKPESPAPTRSVQNAASRW